MHRSPTELGPTRAGSRRSCLIVPADQERFYAKADQSNADQVVFDLEDSVATGVKARARDRVISALKTYEFAGKLKAVRINACDTAWCYEDIITLVEAAGERIDSLVVPKVEGAHHVHFVATLLDQIERKRRLHRSIGLELQIESASGLQNVALVAAASSRNQTLILGPADLAASLRIPELTIGDLPMPDRGYADYVSVRLLVAARAHGLDAIDGPYARIKDAEGLRISADRAASLGFDGKWAVHPAQIDALNEAFAPRQEDLDRAAAILDAYQRAADDDVGALMYGDEMIDGASLKLAASIAERGLKAGMKPRAPGPPSQGRSR